MKQTIITTTILLGLCFSNIYGQSTTKSNDVSYESLDSIITNLYASISGKKTKERDFGYAKSFFYKDARLIIYTKNEKGEYKALFVTPEEYFAKVSEYFKSHDFFEREISRKVDTFGPITQVFSTYESSESEDKKVKPFARGINSIQLLNDGKRWWIINLYWTSETAENPIPKEYLPK
ncbi:MAG: hypothetical protein L6262_03360 [Weeksellaceae bacterium]|nr:hypothetical protein [Weeksellaceae bacterium]